MRIISFGFGIKKKIILPFISSIFYFLSYLSLTKLDNNINLYILLILSQLLFGIIYIILKYRSKRKSLIINDKLLDKIILIKYNYIKILILSIIISFLSLNIIFEFDCYLNKKENINLYSHNPLFFIICGNFGIFIIGFFSYFKSTIGKHHKLTINLSLILLLILIYIKRKILMKIFTNYYKYHVLIPIIFSPIKELLINYLIISLSFSSYFLIFFNGILQSIYFIIYYLFSDVSVFQIINIKSIILATLFILFYSMFLLCKINTNYFLSPGHCIIIYFVIALIFSGYLTYEFSKKTIFLREFVYFIYSLIFLIFNLIYNEIIILHFFNLDKDTMKKIDERAINEDYNILYDSYIDEK
jgi:hypothetical protein